MSDWERRLAEYFRGCEKLRFKYGQHDCGRFALGAMVLMGACAPLPPSYSDAREYRAWVRHHGGLEAAVQTFANDLGLREVPPGMARRGDAVLLAHDRKSRVVLGVVALDGCRAWSPSMQGLVAFSMDRARRAWRVG